MGYGRLALILASICFHDGFTQKDVCRNSIALYSSNVIFEISISMI